jgi:hypothetical protein
MNPNDKYLHDVANARRLISSNLVTASGRHLCSEFAVFLRVSDTNVERKLEAIKDDRRFLIALRDKIDQRLKWLEGTFSELNIAAHNKRSRAESEKRINQRKALIAEKDAAIKAEMDAAIKDLLAHGMINK